MTVHSYHTSGGKDLILDYILSLSKAEIVDGLSVLTALEEDKLDELTVSHWQGKIYEIYFYKHNRVFYVTMGDTDIYLLHACRKQKNKTEKKDTDIVIKRAKALGEELSQKVI